MSTKSRLLLAAAILAGSATVAFAQTWPYDQTSDHYLSYGPKAQTAPQPAPQHSEFATDPYNPNDATSDKYLSYGVRPQR